MISFKLRSDMAQALFFIGVFLLAVAIKFGAGWALGLGFVALLIPCAVPVGRFLFRPYR